MKLKNLILAFTVLIVSACGLSPKDLQAEQESKARRNTAWIMFQERCKTAGEFIHRTAENVESILLLKVRPDKINYRKQYEMDDPYGKDPGGDLYIESFVRGSYQANSIGTSAPGSPERIGYLYVEAIDPADGKRYRYTGGMKAVRKKDVNAEGVQRALKRDPNHDLNIYRFLLDKVPAPGPAPRYGVTYDDISTREERDYWIAGSSLRVIDLKTNGVVAERIGYMFDPGQGDDGGGRAPWLFAANNACPSFYRNYPDVKEPYWHASGAQTRQTQEFVEKVLKPKLKMEK
jgi:hypothetical protein